MSLVVRAKADPLALVNAVRNAVGQLDPALAVRIRLMDQIADTSVATPRLAFLLVGLFAGLAIVLAVIGTYGVISYAVAQRSAEFGLRIALGAQRKDVMRLVFFRHPFWSWQVPLLASCWLWRWHGYYRT